MERILNDIMEVWIFLGVIMVYGYLGDWFYFKELRVKE